MDVKHIPRTQTFADFLSMASSDKLEFTRVGFRDPFLIVYSSGTTGEPKCIVHCVGGVLLNTNKEARLNRSMDATATILQYTTTGWIMYMSCVSALIFGARPILFDGSPFLPDITILVKLLEKHKCVYPPRWRLSSCPNEHSGLRTSEHPLDGCTNYAKIRSALAKLPISDT